MLRRISELWQRLTVNLERKEKLVFILLCIGLAFTLACFAVTFYGQVMEAEGNPQISATLRTRKEFPLVDFIVIESRRITDFNYSSDYRGYHPVFTPWPTHDFAFSELLAASPFIQTNGGSQSGIRAFLVRPRKETVEHATISFHVGGVNGQSGSIIVEPQVLQIRVHRVPVPLTFTDSGTSVVASSDKECMFFINEYRQFLDPGQTDLGYNLSGEFSSCGRTRISNNLVMNTINYSTCSNSTEFFPNKSDVVCQDAAAWEKRYQNGSSWPNGSFYIIPVDRAFSKKSFNEIYDKLNTLASRISMRMVLYDFNAMQFISINGLTAFISQEWSNGAWVSLQPQRQVAVQQLVLSTSSCAGYGCKFPGTYEFSIAFKEIPVWLEYYPFLHGNFGRQFLVDYGMNICDWQSHARNCMDSDYRFGIAPLINNTMLTASMQEVVNYGMVTFTWSNAFGLLASYFNTGKSILSFVFPTLISVGYYFRWGEWIRAQRVRGSPEQIALSAS